MTDSEGHLLEPGELAELGTPEAVRLPLDLIDPNARNPRRDLPEVDLLAENIRTFGLLQPVTVRRVGDRYELLGGHRRRAAFQMLRDIKDPLNIIWRTIPAVVRTMGDDESYLALISAQVHNRNWRPREEAFALEQLAVTGLTFKQIGQRLTRSEAWASKRLKVYADSVLSGYVQSGTLLRAIAEEMLPIRDQAIKQEMAARAAAEGWSQDYTRGQVRALRLDLQLREVGRQAKTLLDLLSSIDASQLPLGAMKDLWMLRGRIIALGRGPVLPPVVQAPTVKPRRNSTRKTRRTMPPPA